MNGIFTHLAKDEVSWMTRCGVDLTGRDDGAISHNPDHVSCPDCVPPKVQALAGEPVYGEPFVAFFMRFQRAPLEVYEDEIHDKAIYPGKGTGSSVALSYTLGGRINELGEYCEKFLPIAEDAAVSYALGQELEDQKTLGEFIDILRMMVAVGKRAHAFKKPLRKGLTKVPPFRSITPVEREGLDAEDGDFFWYAVAHTTERAGKRSWGRVILQNILKLMGRKERKTIEGDGDVR